MSINTDQNIPNGVRSTQGQITTQESRISKKTTLIFEGKYPSDVYNTIFQYTHGSASSLRVKASPNVEVALIIFQGRLSHVLKKAKSLDFPMIELVKSRIWYLSRSLTGEERERREALYKKMNQDPLFKEITSLTLEKLEKIIPSLEFAFLCSKENFVYQALFLWAIQKGIAEIARSLLEKNKLTPYSKDCELITRAVQTKNISAIKDLTKKGFLSKREDPDPYSIDFHDNIYSEKFFLSENELKKAAIKLYGEDRYEELVQLLHLVDPFDVRLVPTYDDYLKLLLQYDHIKPELHKVKVIRFFQLFFENRAKRVGDSNRSFNPRQKDDAWLQIASQYGFTRVVQILLEDTTDSIEPGADGNRALKLAFHKKHFDTVCRLLKDYRVDGSVEKNRILFFGCKKNDERIVEAVLSNKHVNPSVENNLAIRLASQKGHIGILKRLLKDYRTDPSAKKSEALRVSASKGKTKIVKLLVKDGRVDPTACSNEAVWSAIENGHSKVVSILLSEKGVGSGISIDEAIEKAKPHPNVVEVLQKYKKETLSLLPMKKKEVAPLTSKENVQPQIRKAVQSSHSPLRKSTPFDKIEKSTSSEDFCDSFFALRPLSS